MNTLFETVTNWVDDPAMSPLQHLTSIEVEAIAEMVAVWRAPLAKSLMLAWAQADEDALAILAFVRDGVAVTDLHEGDQEVVERLAQWNVVPNEERTEWTVFVAKQRRITYQRSYNVRRVQVFDIDVPDAMFEDTAYFVDGNPTPEFDSWVCDNNDADYEDYEIVEDDDLTYAVTSEEA